MLLSAASAADGLDTLNSPLILMLAVAATALIAYRIGRTSRRGPRAPWASESDDPQVPTDFRLDRRADRRLPDDDLADGPNPLFDTMPLPDLRTYRYSEDLTTDRLTDRPAARHAGKMLPEPSGDLERASMERHAPDKADGAAPRTDPMPAVADTRRLKESAMPHLAWLIPLASSAAAPIPIEKPLTTLGRDRSRDIVLDNETVSRKHATIEHQTGDGWWLTSHQVRNGTFVNEEPLTAGERRKLFVGDQIRLGDTILVFLTPYFPGSVRRARPAAMGDEPGPVTLTFDSAGATSVGGRATNNDVYVIRQEWLAVADGMGKSGEGALAAKLVEDALRSEEIVRRPLMDAIDQINTTLYETPRKTGRGLRAIGSTLDIIRIGPHDTVEGIHIGDGSVFVRTVRGDVVVLTSPHTDVDRWATIRPGRRSHRLTRGIGFESTAEPDRWDRAAAVGDRYLLATDGLLDAFGADGRHEVATALQHSGNQSPRELVDQLMNTMLKSNPGDNVTVIVADVIPKQRKEIRK
ncbi:FHA domain-containing protein [Nocardia gamkensis]|uniref:FHA domain-containing protein n=1 Tax=Nocardia gamkensis TaxID=352869 RepID=UPI0037C6A198